MSSSGDWRIVPEQGPCGLDRERAQACRKDTHFTDCPYTALLYGRGSRGVLLVVDIPPDGEILVTEELWLDAAAKRFMIWGPFDGYIVEVIAAKELRAEVPRKRTLSEADKAILLRHVIERRLAASTGVPVRAQACRKDTIAPSLRRMLFRGNPG